METTRQPRIVIEDLPAEQPLTQAEMAALVGAGWPRARLNLEMLETRELMAANLFQGLAVIPSPVAHVPSGEAAQQVVFIDSSVPNYQELLSGPVSGQVIILADNQDGIQQMAAALAGRSGVDSVQVVSHGRPVKRSSATRFSTPPLHSGPMPLPSRPLGRPWRRVQTWNCTAATSPREKPVRFSAATWRS